MVVRLYVGPAYGHDVSVEELREQVMLWDPESGAPMPRRARTGEYLRTNAGDLVWLGDDPITLPADWLQDESAREVSSVLRRAHLRQGGQQADDFEVYFTAIPGDEFRELAEARDEEYAPIQTTSMAVGRTVSLVVRTIVPRRAKLTEGDIAALASRHLPPDFTRASVELGRATSQTDTVEVTAALRPRSRVTIGQFTLAGDGLAAVLGAGPLDAESVLALVAAGRGDLVVGQLESDWLEVKSAAYRLSEPAQAIEAAQDVARLANGQGGLLLLGYRTKKRQQEEVVASVAPIPEARAEVRRLRHVVDAHVYPPVPGLRVTFHRLTGVDGGVVAILVPRQDAALRPFLVQGTVAAGRVEGAFFSIVARRGDDSVPVVASHVHALLAGRLLQDPAPLQDGVNTPSAGAFSTDIPTLRPGMVADPSDARDSDVGLVIRAAVVRRIPSHVTAQIEPRHRKRLSASLASDGRGVWGQPGSEWQSSTNAVFTREERGDAERLVVSTRPGFSMPYVLADRVYRTGVGFPLSLDRLVEDWTALLRAAGSSAAPSIRAIAHSEEEVVSVELHIEARPAGAADIRSLVDLESLGDARALPLQAASYAWDPRWLTHGAERSLVLETLRKAALDWGFIDPDQALKRLGWQSQ